MTNNLTDYETKVLKEFNGESQDLVTGNAVNSAVKKLKDMGYLSGGTFPYITYEGKEVLYNE